MWKDDGSNVTKGDGNTVRCVSDIQGSQAFNALWCIDPQKSDYGGICSYGEYCFSFELLEGDVKVGVTTPAYFKRGWGCRGFFYGGNVSDGGALLTQNFGPRPKAGDVVDVVLALSEEKLEVAFIINGRRLGVAFSIAASYPTGLLPVVSFSSLTGSLTIKKSIDIPPNYRTREIQRQTGIEGEWTPVQGSEFYHKSEPTIGIQLKNQGTSMEMWVRVVNIAHFTMKPIEDGMWLAEAPGVSTRMLGPPDRMAIEKILQNFMHEALFISLDDTTNNLRISNNSTTPPKQSEFKRYYWLPPICTVNPLLRS